MMKTVYVDFDGTIVDVMPRYFGILESYLKRHQLSNMDYNVYKKLKRQGFKDHEIVQKMFNGYTLDIEHYLNYKRTNMEELKWLKEDIIIGTPKEAYFKLKCLEYKVVLLTQRNRESNLTEQIRLLKIEDYFDEIVVVKPLKNQNAKMIYLKDRVNNHDIIIGDSKVEMESAKKLSLQGYFVMTGLWDESFSGDKAMVFKNYNSAVDFIASKNIKNLGE